MKTNKKIIPIVFATDNNYAPYLAVTLQSIINHMSEKNVYNIYVLETTLTDDMKTTLKTFERKNLKIMFINVGKELDKIGSLLHMRDYYTNTTYYRFFIPSILKQYNKCLYLDCDIVVLDDIANLYNYNIENKLLGAITEDVMPTQEVFVDYVENALGINVNKYFNAGILIMNLKKLRSFNIDDKFKQIISKFKFVVAQDQDYLNVLCKNKVKYLPQGWNKAPFNDGSFDEKTLKIAHYKMDLKPWNKPNIMFENYFWEVAKQTMFYDKFIENKNNYTKEKEQKDIDGLVKLKAKAYDDANNPNNYFNTVKKLKTSKLSIENILFNLNQIKI